MIKPKNFAQQMMGPSPVNTSLITQSYIYFRFTLSDEDTIHEIKKRLAYKILKSSENIHICQQKQELRSDTQSSSNVLIIPHSNKVERGNYESVCLHRST